MFWKTKPNALEKIDERLKRQQKEIGELQQRITEAEIGANIHFFLKPYEGLVNARTKKYSMREAVYMLLDYLELQIRHTEESYVLEKRDSDG